MTTGKPIKLPTRRRRTADEARTDAVREARRLLLEQGPQAVTLKNVAAPLGMTHVNLIHHFGSAEKLQTALMESMVADLRQQLTHRDYVIQPGDGSARRFVDIVFDAFAEGGAGKLVAWIALSRDKEAMESLAAMAAEIAKDMSDPNIPELQSAASFVTVASLALAHSLAGGVMARALGLPGDGAREIAAELLLDVLGRK